MQKLPFKNRGFEILGVVVCFLRGWCDILGGWYLFVVFVCWVCCLQCVLYCVWCLLLYFVCLICRLCLYCFIILFCQVLIGFGSSDNFCVLFICILMFLFCCAPFSLYYFVFCFILFVLLCLCVLFVLVVCCYLFSFAVTCYRVIACFTVASVW